MITKIKKYLYARGLLKLTESIVTKWAKNKDIDGLVLALDKGIYNIRIMSIQFLIALLGDQAVNMIEKCIDDPVHKVSDYTMDQIENITSDKALLERIEKKRQFWKVKHQDKSDWRPYYQRSFGYQDIMSEKPPAKSLRIFKQQQEFNDGIIGF